MTQIQTFDFLRLCDLQRRTITVDIPAALVARKGKSRVSRARAQRVESDLRKKISEEFQRAGRRAYRGEVAVHLDLHGVEMSEAARTVKALVDAMQGAIFVDDRAVALLDVTTSPGPLSAKIATCAVNEYADAFDVLAGVRSDDAWDDRDWDDIDQPNPWAWAHEISPSAEMDLETTRENLAFAEADSSVYPADLRKQLIEFDRKRIREYELNALLGTPFLPIDRPGPPSIQGRLWNDRPHLGGPPCFVIPAPSRGSGSWSEIVRKACLDHLENWRIDPSLLQAKPVAFDIAIGREAAGVFDVDNLAHRVLRGFREVVPSLPNPSSFRVYRRHGADDAVVVRLHSARRANDLRWLLVEGWGATSGLRPDMDATSHRRRSSDDEMYQEIQKIATSLDAEGP